MVSDNDTKFNNEPVNDYAKYSGMNWKFLSTYNPRGNAKVERMVGTLKRAIKKMVMSTEAQWDECLEEVLQGYRRRRNKDRSSPFEVMFRIQPGSPWSPLS